MLKIALKQMLWTTCQFLVLFTTAVEFGGKNVDPRRTSLPLWVGMAKSIHVSLRFWKRPASFCLDLNCTHWASEQITSSAQQAYNILGLKASYCLHGFAMAEGSCSLWIPHSIPGLLLGCTMRPCGWSPRDSSSRKRMLWVHLTILSDTPFTDRYKNRTVLKKANLSLLLHSVR